jgi:hypothetical protein
MATKTVRAIRNALLLCASLSALGSSPLRAQAPQEDRKAIYFPESPGSGEWRTAFGVVMIKPAKEITEEATLRAPAFDLHALYGLPEGFAVDGRVLSQILQNHFSLGPRWAHKFGPLHAGLGYDVAYWFGALDVGGMDSRANGWINYPNVTVGYDFGDVQVSLRADAILTTAYNSWVGDSQVSTDVNTFSGMSYALMIEQPFWKQTSMTLGFRATYTKFHWMMWSLYSTFDRYLFYPEIIIGFML